MFPSFPGLVSPRLRGGVKTESLAESSETMPLTENSETSDQTDTSKTTVQSETSETAPLTENSETSDQTDTLETTVQSETSETISQSETSETLSESETISETEESEASSESSKDETDVTETETETDTDQADTVEATEEVSDNPERSSEIPAEENTISTSTRSALPEQNDNTDMTVYVGLGITQKDCAGDGTQGNPYSYSMGYLSSKTDSVLVETANPAATIDGSVGSKTFSLSYGWNDLTFAVTSSDGTAVAYYHIRLERTKIRRPSDKIDADSLGLTMPTGADAADGEIYGLNPEETYDYKRSTSDTWISLETGTTKITGLSAGTYDLRYGETDTYMASSNKSQVTLTAAQPHTITLSDDLKSIWDGNIAWTESASKGERVYITLTLPEGALVEYFKVTTLGGMFSTTTQYNGPFTYDGNICTAYFKTNTNSSQQITEIKLLDGTWYTLGMDYDGNYISVKVSPQNDEDVKVINNQTYYAEGSSLIFHVEGGDDQIVESYTITDKETGEVLATSETGEDVSIQLNKNTSVRIDAKVQIILADFTELDQALETVPQDLSVYTDSTRSALQTLLYQAEDMYRVTRHAQNLVDEYVEKLNAAIQNLVYRDGDYSKVNEALNRIPDDLSVYIEESVEALNAAVNSVIWDKDMSEQTLIDSYGENISKAVDNLVYLPADYSAVNAALAKVPSNLTIYTQESVDTLNNAINSVVWDLNITQQNQADEYAKAIEEAIQSLILLPAESETTIETESETETQTEDQTELQTEKQSETQAETQTQTNKSGSNGNTTAASTSSPDTGDHTPLFMMYGTLLISGAVIIGFLFERKKKEKIK